MNIKTPNLILDTVAEESEIDLLAKEICSHLLKDDPFVLWLSGEMGAGKTTITRHILRYLGLNEIIPVTSPTFTYLNEYEIDENIFAHMDLFRVNDHFEAEELGVGSDREFRGYFIEWPSQISNDQFLDPTHKLEIEYIDSLKQRKYRLSQVFKDNQT